jgi:RNA polymerase sigma-70 factor (ECF subfamily)
LAFPEPIKEVKVEDRGRVRAVRRAMQMEATQQGDTEAYRALLEDIGPEIRRFLRSRLPDRQEVDDVYQETLLALHRARHTYKAPRPVEPWLFAIASHVAARYMRRQRARSAREIAVDQIPDWSVAEDGAASLKLTRALDCLPPKHRQAIELLKLEGLSTEAAAARAGTTPAALRVRAHRAYKALRQWLGDER